MSQAAAVRLFVPQLLTSAAALIFTVPADPGTDLFEGGIVRFINTDVTGRTITAYAVPAGGSPLPANCVAFSMTVGTAVPIDVQLPLMGPGDMLYALASVTGVVSISQLGGILITDS